MGTLQADGSDAGQTNGGGNVHDDSMVAIIGRVRRIAARQDCVTIGDVIKSVGAAGFAPILLLPALAVTTPLSGIPAFSAMMGVVIFLVSVQMLFRRDHLWLPEWVLHREVRGKVVRDAFGKLRPVGHWLDRHTGRRLRVLGHRPFIFVPQLLCVVSGAVMPLLEFVPFSSSVLGAGVTLLAVGMLSRDGLLLLLGMVPFAATVWIVTNALA